MSIETQQAQPKERNLVLIAFLQILFSLQSSWTFLQAANPTTEVHLFCFVLFLFFA